MIDCSGGGGEDVEDGEIIDDEEDQVTPTNKICNEVTNVLNHEEKKDSFHDIFGAARGKADQQDEDGNKKKPKDKLKRTGSPERNDDKCNRGNRHGGPLRRKRGRDSEDEMRQSKVKRRVGEKMNSPGTDDLDEQEMIYVLGGNSPTYSKFKGEWDSEDDGERDGQHEGDDCGRRRDGYFSNARESRRARLNRGTARQRRFFRKAEVTLCRYFMQGKCSRGNECPFVHSGLPPKKMELCKFYSNDCCTKKDKCLYMHNDFPCKFYQSGFRCFAGKRCKFYHGKISNYLRNIMNKHIRKIDLEHEYEQHKKEYGAVDRRDRPNCDKYNERHEKRRSQDEDEERGSTPMPSPQREQFCNEGSHSPPDKSSHPRRRSRDQDGSLEVEEDDPGFGSGDGGSPPVEHKFSGKHHDEQPIQHRHGSGRVERLRQGERRMCRSRERVRHRDRHRNERAHSPKKDHFNDKHDYDGRRRPDQRGSDFSPPSNEYKDIYEVESGGKSAEENHLGEDQLPANLPKVQRELIKRIQQQQHERPPDPQPTRDFVEEEDYKEENWYSSDEDGGGGSGSAQPSPLSTIFNNVPGLKGTVDNDSTSNKSEQPSLPASTSKMLADIDVNAVSKLLSSVRESIKKKGTEPLVKNEVEDNQRPNNSLTSNLSGAKQAEDKRSRDPRLRANSERKVRQASPVLLTNTDLDLRLSDPQTGVSQESSGFDVDLRKLPFKPVPHHQAGNEIDASINSHPPIDYHLVALPVIRPDYSSIAKRASVQMGALDPRLRKYMSAQVTQCVVMMSSGGGMPPVVSQNSGMPLMMSGIPSSGIPTMESKMVVQPPAQLNMMSALNDPRTAARETKALLANDPRRRGAAAAAAAASRAPPAVLDHDHRIGLLPHPRPPAHFLPHPEADIDLRVHPGHPQNYYQ